MRNTLQPTAGDTNNTLNVGVSLPPEWFQTFLCNIEKKCRNESATNRLIRAREAIYLWIWITPQAKLLMLWLTPSVIVIMQILSPPCCSLFPCRSHVLCSAGITCYSNLHVKGVHLPGPPPVCGTSFSSASSQREDISGGKLCLDGRVLKGKDGWFYPCTGVYSILKDVISGASCF